MPSWPSRGPSASGSAGARRRASRACANNSGESTSFSARDMAVSPPAAGPPQGGRAPPGGGEAAQPQAWGSSFLELREVGLALLKERAERFLCLGAAQARAEHFGLDL